MTSTIQSNVLCARGIYDCIMGTEFNLLKAQEDANKIYLNGLAAIQAEVKAPSIAYCDWMPVVVELNRITGLENIQHNVPLLNSLVKAHRIMVELVWVNCWQEEMQYVNPDTREHLLQIVKVLKQVLPTSTIIRGGVLVSSSGAQYETSCMKQAAKCLALKDQILATFPEEITGSIEDLRGRINIGSLFTTLIKAAKAAHHEIIASWYIEIFSLEWLATNITTMDVFQEEIDPHLTHFSHKGNKHTLSLVKIFTLIFQNRESTPELKEKVFQELLILLAITPEYNLKEAIKHPDQIFNKLLKKPDRYASTRNFALTSLLDLAAKEDNISYRLRIKEVVEERCHKVRDQTSRSNLEKQEAKKHLMECSQEIAVLDTKSKALNQQLESLALGITRDKSTENYTNEDQLFIELEEIEKEQMKFKNEQESYTKEIALAETFETLQNEEFSLLSDLLSTLSE